MTDYDYNCDSNSDSITSENQPLVNIVLKSEEKKRIDFLVVVPL